MSILYSDLISDAQAKSDMLFTDFVDDPRWLVWAYQSVKELHRVVCATFADTYFRTTDFSIASPAFTYTLPANFMRIKGLDRDPGLPTRYSVPRFNFAERNDDVGGYGGGFFGGLRRKRISYNVVGSNILELSPQENAPANYRLYWVPRPLAPVDATSALDPELEPYAEYVSTKMAVMALIKEESWDAVNALQGQLAQMRADMAEAVQTDEGAPATIIDVHGGRDWE